MGSTYTRQSSTEIVDGEVINASDFNNEFEQLVSAFAVSTGHSHDGTTAEGGPVTKLLGTAITIGDGTSGTDIAVTFDGESSDGVLTWMEDEDHFKFSDDVVIDSSKRIYLYDEGGEYIYGDGTDLYLVSGADINIPANIGLTFGNDGEKIEGDGTDLTISGNNIKLTATADVVIPADVGITFGTGEKIEGNSTDLTVTSGADINLTATSDVNIPSGVGVTFGDDGEKIEGDGTDLTISGNNINLTATADVVIPADVGITFGSGEKIEGNNTDLTITSGADIALTATGDVNIPTDVGVTFGDDGEKIEGDGTDLTISASALFNVDAGTDIVLDAGGGDIFFKDDGTTFGSATNTSGDLIIKSGTTTAMTFSGANVTFAGTVTIGSAGISETELEILDGATVTTTELNLIDGGTSRGTTAVASGDGILINNAGTMAMTNVDTVSTYFSSHNVGGGNIVTTGALDSGSITSGFGAIDNGTSGIRTDTFTAETSIVPDASGGADIGTSSLEWGDVYVADDKYIQFGSDQNIIVGYDEDGNDTLEFKANVEAAALGLTFSADQADDNADTWKLNFADGGTITWQSYTSGSFVTKQTLDTSGNLTLTGAIELGHASDTTIARSGSGDITIEGNAVYRAGGTDVPVADGGTGASSLTDGGVLLGSGTGAVTAMSVLADSEMIVGDGSTDPVAESGATLRTSIGVGTGDSPQFTGIELGHASDTTIVRSGSGDITIEGNAVYRAGGTDVPVADGGTGASSLTDGGVLLGSGTGAVTAMAVLANGEMIVGDGTTDPVPESGSTLRTSIGLGTFAVENVNAVPALTLAAAITGADQTVSAINLKDYGEVTNAIGGTGGGTQDIDLNAGNNVTATVDTSTNTFTFSNPTASDELCGFTLFLTNGGSQTVNWPGTVDWAGGTAPTLTTSGLDILVFITTDGGTIWHGMVASAASA